MSPACRALVDAFSPGLGALRTCLERSWDVPGAAGERITLDFDVTDELARIRAATLERKAAAIVDGLRLGHTPQRVVYCTAWVGVGRVFTVDAMVMRA